MPVVFKPVDSSGSRGITIVDSRDPSICHAAFLSAREFSRTDVVCVEEYVEGIDVGGDGLLIDGILHAAVTRKFANGLVPIGHRLPADLPPDTESLVLHEVSTHCHLLGYSDGPIDFDVRVSPGKATVIEMTRGWVETVYR